MKLTKKIFIEPKYLDKQILINYISKTLEKEYKYTCNKKYGFILNIAKIHEFSDIILNDKGYGITNVCFTINNIKPEPKLKLNAVIISIHCHGIMALPQDMAELKMQKPSIPIWIGVSELNKCKLTYKSSTFTDGLHKNIEKGDIVSVTLLNIIYRQNMFSCLATINI